MMKILILSILFVLSIRPVLYADVIDDFMAYSYSAVSDGNTTHKLFIESWEGKKRQDIQMLVSETAKAIFLENNIQKIVFLYHKNGNAWMMSNKTTRPLKVTLRQNVTSNLNVEDIAGVDIRTHYMLEETISDTELLLKSINRRTAYPYVGLQKKSDTQYSIIYYDKNKKPLKQIIYSLVRIKNKTFWGEMEARDLVFHDIQTITSKVVSWEEVSVPKSMFSSNTMKRLFLLFQ